MVEFEILNNGDALLAGALTQNSDVINKSNIEEINPHSVLAKVMGLSISEWSYKGSPDARHVGPMAQDFYQAFQLGHTEKNISSIETGGVALAAIQAVKLENDQQIGERDRQIAALNQKISRQSQRLAELESALAKLTQVE